MAALILVGKLGTNVRIMQFFYLIRLVFSVIYI